MADFSHLRTLDVNPASEAEFVFEDIPGEPSIWFRPMTDANPDYLNERVRLAVERAETATKETKAQRKKRVLSSDQLEEDREQDRILLARTCAIRWGKPPRDVNDVEHDFSVDNCLDFLRALPNYMIDPLRGWAANVYNFVDKDARKALEQRLTERQADELGNS